MPGESSSNPCKLRFLVDVGVGRKVERWLARNGYDCLPVRDVDCRAKDMDILRMAVAEKRMVVTMDKDFGELVYNGGELHAGVLILRLEDADSDEKVRTIEAILPAFADKIEGCFCVYRDGRLRIRKRSGQ